MRRGNLELRRYSSSDRWEIVKWQPNPYYGKESEYIRSDNGYIDGKRRHVVIDESCFVNPETCYSLAFIENGIPDYVGNRPLELTDIVEILDFLELLRKGVTRSQYVKIVKD